MCEKHLHSTCMFWGRHFWNSRLRNSYTPLHKNNRSPGKNHQNQNFQTCGNELKTCSNLRSVDSRKTAASLKNCNSCVIFPCLLLSPFLQLWRSLRAFQSHRCGCQENQQLAASRSSMGVELHRSHPQRTVTIWLSGNLSSLFHSPLPTGHWSLPSAATVEWLGGLRQHYH